MLLASGSIDATIRLWRRAVTPGRWMAIDPSLTGQQDQVREVAFSPDGKLLASSSLGGSIWFWDLSGALSASGTSTLGAARPSAWHSAALTTHAGELGAMAISPTRNTLAAGGLDDTTIQLWDVAHRQPQGAPLAGQPASVERIVFSPDGALLASTGDDGSVMLWDMRRGAPLGGPLTTAANPTGTLSFSRDGTILVLAGGDQAVLWDVAHRRPLGPPLTTRAGALAGVAFSPTGDLVATGGVDGTLLLWDISGRAAVQTVGTGGTLDSRQLTALMQRACRLANRNLTRQEWQFYFGNTPYHPSCSGRP
jgi:WD40 repeat protein